MKNSNLNKVYKKYVNLNLCKEEKIEALRLVYIDVLCSIFIYLLLISAICLIINFSEVAVISYVFILIIIITYKIISIVWTNSSKKYYKMLYDEANEKRLFIILLIYFVKYKGKRKSLLNLLFPILLSSCEYEALIEGMKKYNPIRKDEKYFLSGFKIPLYFTLKEFDKLKQHMIILKRSYNHISNPTIKMLYDIDFIIELFVSKNYDEILNQKNNNYFCTYCKVLYDFLLYLIYLELGYSKEACEQKDKLIYYNNKIYYLGRIGEIFEK